MQLVRGIHNRGVVSIVRPIGLNVQAYQSYLRQSCHPACCSHEEPSPFSPILALQLFLWRCKVTTRQPKVVFWAMAKNGSTRCFFGQKRMYPENNSGRECCWPYLIGQHPLSPVFGQKRPGTPGNSYFAQLPPVFGHFMFLSGGLLDCSNRSTWVTRTINSKISTR